VIAPALAGKLAPRAAADAVVNARVAALADPDGDTLSRTQSPCCLPAPCR
jgi:indolepyruvate ferredoxin oxidoreductase beta subunit